MLTNLKILKSNQNNDGKDKPEQHQFISSFPTALRFNGEHIFKSALKLPTITLTAENNYGSSKAEAVNH